LLCTTEVTILWEINDTGCGSLPSNIVLWNSGKKIMTFTTFNNSYHFNGLTPGTNYTVQVIGNDAADSLTINFTTPTVEDALPSSK